MHNIRCHKRGKSPKSSEHTYLHYTTLQYITLHYIHYITLHSCTGLGVQNRMSPEGPKSYGIRTYILTLPYIALHYITLHHSTVHYSTLRYIHAQVHKIVCHQRGISPKSSERTHLHYITVHYITLHAYIHTLGLGLGAHNCISPEGHKS